jgi:hypothetical protein
MAIAGDLSHELRGDTDSPPLLQVRQDCIDFNGGIYGIRHISAATGPRKGNDNI